MMIILFFTCVCVLIYVRVHTHVETTGRSRGENSAISTSAKVALSLLGAFSMDNDNGTAGMYSQTFLYLLIYGTKYPISTYCCL